MKFKSLDKFNFVYTGIVMFIFILIAVSNFFNFGRSGYNSQTLILYAIGGVVGLVLSLFFGVMGVFNFLRRKNSETTPFSVGHVSESNKFLIFSNNIFAKITPHVIYSILILFLAISGFQIWGEPDVYANYQEFSVKGDDPSALAFNKVGSLESLWNLALVPAFTEDMASFGLSAVIVGFILLWGFIMFNITKKKLFKFNAFWLIISILIACPIASFGLGFIPGFTQAHQIVGGQNIGFLFSTFTFQTGNLYVMWFTGLFLPLAHFLHNAVYVLGFSFAFSIAFCFLAINKNKIRRMIK